MLSLPRRGRACTPRPASPAPRTHAHCLQVPCGQRAGFWCGPPDSICGQPGDKGCDGATEGSGLHTPVCIDSGLHTPVCIT